MTSKQTFSIRKLKIGAVSVLLGAVFLVSSNGVLADELGATTVETTTAQTQVTSSEVQTQAEETVLPETTTAKETTSVAETTEVTASVTEAQTSPESDVTTQTKEAVSSEVEEITSVSGSNQEISTATSKETKPSTEQEITTQAVAEAQVAPATAVKPLDESSNGIISAPQVWNEGYKGEGTVVAIIDSGIDVDHDTMALTDITKAKYQTQQAMTEAMAAAGITYGKWYNNKVIYAYNYYDSSDDIKEEGTHSHGMHVSSIAAGNSQVADKETNELVKGVAPEAQLMFMRVFSDRLRTTDESIYARAILDAVKLGADSINLSLGSSSGSTIDSSDVLKNAIKTAKEAGVTVAISAGNAANFGYGATPVSAKNPDFATVGNPSTTKDVISVASFNNSTYYSSYVTVDGQNKVNFPSVATEGSVDFDTDKSYDYTYVGLGTKEAIGDTDLTGKVALIQRGSITFTEKIKNAKAAGAIGVVVFNNNTGFLSGGMSVDEEELDIPSVFVTKDAGDLLLSGEHQLIFNKGLGKINSDEANQLSDFSSWGLTSDGFLKPDLTAPGGDIYAAGNDNTYNLNSGTSMASPHVAGAIALVKEYLTKNYPELKGEELSETIKNLLMSTAKAHYDTNSKAYTSPRQQGAGLIDLAAATSTGLYVTGLNNDASLTLGDVKDQFEFDVTLHNITDQDKTLSYVTQLQTDATKDGSITLLPLGLETIKGESVTVKAHSTQTVHISIDATGYATALQKAMPNGYYLEGFVRFLDPVDQGEVVSIPYVGFRGDFENLTVVEDSIYQLTSEGAQGIYDKGAAQSDLSADSDVTSLVTESSTIVYSQGIQTGSVSKVLGSFQNEDGHFSLYKDGFGKAHLAISPNADGNQDSLTFKGVFLRNYKDLEVAVYAKDDTNQTNPLWSTYVGSGEKDAYEQGSGTKSTLVTNTQWYGQDKDGKSLADGDYVYVVSYYSAVPGADKQSMSFDVTIDTTDPQITTAAVTTTENGTLFKPNAIYENGSGIYSEEVFYLVKTDNGTFTNITIDKETGLISLSDNRVTVQKSENGTYLIPTDVSLDNAYYLVTDFAGNRAVQKVSAMAKLPNGKGIVNVFTRDITNQSAYNKLIAYKIYDATGNEVVAPTYHNGFLNSLELPFGSYSIVLQSFDDENGTVVGDKTLKVLINEEHSISTVYFDFQPIVRATTVITFTQSLGKAVQLILIDENGKQTVIPEAIYDPGTFSYNLVVGKYKVQVALPTGYEVLEDLELGVVANTVNQKTFTLITKESLSQELTNQTTVTQEARYFNASQNLQTAYLKAKEEAESVLARKSSQEEIDTTLALLKASYDALDGKATDFSKLENSLKEASSIQSSQRFINAKSKEQRVYLEALNAAQKLLDNSETVTQAELDKYLADLTQAEQNLSGKENQVSALEDLVTESYYMLNTRTYKKASSLLKRQFLIALQTADLILSDESARQRDIDLALYRLKRAYLALRNNSYERPSYFYTYRR
ncbi:S8 family serine peptidase [Streptococcus saliviloxodontae]|uniref:Lactocepin n=1 Tax=Streptococcus saliviloxodontae TaxID=1349416 RepID=A0ABS2PM07_9STRE|nr:S8 family serine peptidase [Streptococcus saliviloxodontae]MBM7636121.1 lactocepin [Streptococcus saliviloxodontae]